MDRPARSTPDNDRVAEVEELLKTPPDDDEEDGLADSSATERPPAADEPITVETLFRDRLAYHFTFPEIRVQLDGRTGDTLRNAFHDAAHVEGRQFIDWYRRQAKPPCTVKPALVEMIRSMLAKAKKTVATMGLMFIVGAVYRFEQSLKTPTRQTGMPETSAAPAAAAKPAARSEEVGGRPRGQAEDLGSGGLVEKAASIREGWSEAEEESRKANLADAEQEYLAILLRHDEPRPADAESLASLMMLLNRDQARVEVDLKLIKEARRLIDLRNNAEELGRLAVQARADRVAVETRYKEEFHAARQKEGLAHAKRAEANGAAAQLAALAKRRPLFFTADGKALRLLEG